MDVSCKYFGKLKPSDKAMSSKVTNLKPLSPADFWKMDSTEIVGFFWKYFRTFEDSCAVEIYSF